MKNMYDEYGIVAKASNKCLKVSPIKLNSLVSNIRAKSVAEALVYLSFSKRRIASDVKKILLSAVDNAEKSLQYDIEDLRIGIVNVGKAMSLKRFRARARGRGARISKSFSNIAIYLVVENRKVV